MPPHDEPDPASAPHDIGHNAMPSVTRTGPRHEAMSGAQPAELNYLPGSNT